MSKHFLLRAYFFLLFFGWAGIPIYNGFKGGWDVVDFVISGVSLVGLFGYCWNKDWSESFWRQFLIVFIAWHVFYVVLLPTIDFPSEEFSNILDLVIEVVLSIALITPLTYALYRYSRRSTYHAQINLPRQ